MLSRLFRPSRSLLSETQFKALSNSNIVKRQLSNVNTTDSSTHGDFPGSQSPLPFTTSLDFIRRDDANNIPVYRILNSDGKIRKGAEDPELSKDLVLDMYESIVTIGAMDHIFYEAQRQGRISFYMTCEGEEAAVIGSAAALKNNDEIFSQYRESAALLYRGFTVQQMADQCFGNIGDAGKGRQMPVHYGSRKHHFQTVSSPLATQILHAVGAGYRFKLAKEDRIAVAYFGEGAASEGDFHAALNFATTSKSPTVFFCRNNGWAISTSAHDQFRGDGIAARGPAYGMPTIRVDGEDLLAVYQCMKEARKIALSEETPVLVESMAYRIGHHSTSDDSTRYRSKDEIMNWKKFGPRDRIRKYMINRGWWSDSEDKGLEKEKKREVLKALEAAGNKEKHHLDSLFEDVYDEVPKNLHEQYNELKNHMAKYPNDYNMPTSH